MRTRILAVIVTTAALAALLAASGCTTNVSATTGPRPDTVTVIGVGTGSAAPDRAVLSMSVNAHARSSSDAMNSTTKAMTRLVSAMKAAGLTDAELQTQQISIYQQDSSSSGSSYESSQMLQITTRQLDKLPKILAEATRTGATNISGPDYSMTSKNPARGLAIAAAMDDAKARAAATAKAAGRGLGRVVSVSEVVQDTSTYPLAADFLSTGHANYPVARKAVVTPTVSLGQNEVQAQMAVEYALQ